MLVAVAAVSNVDLQEARCEVQAVAEVRAMASTAEVVVAVVALVAMLSRLTFTAAAATCGVAMVAG